MKLIDLSVLVENTNSEPMKIKIRRLDHVRGAKQFCRKVFWGQFPFKERIKRLFDFVLGKKFLSAKDFPNSAFLSLDIVTLPTHMGTHVDAPFHYGPNENGILGKKVHELPLEWFFQKAVCLDLTFKEPGEYITVEDLKSACRKIDYRLKPLDIVLIHTGTDLLWGKKEYFTHAPGMSREATAWLVDQGIKVIGTDTYGFDRPFNTMIGAFLKTGDRGHLWPAHFYGREKEYIQIERLCNLDKLPSSGFYLVCFPLKIKGLDASWIRAVAIIQ